MDKYLDIFSRGVHFVRNNPQIIYTLFLVIAIPLAFFFTSEQFLKVARENQDRLERSRIGMLQDVFVLFASEKMGDTNLLNERIRQVAEGNETMVTFQILKKSNSDTHEILASLDDNAIGQTVTLDQLSLFLVGSATGNPEQSFASEYFSGGARYWRSVRAIVGTNTDQVTALVLTDLSMADADRVSRSNIQNAYLVLILIIILIIVLLARQARIIDYASLYQRLKEVDTMKDDFVSMAAHELRSPLTIIRGYTEMLGESESLTDTGKGHLHNIDHAATQLNGLIGDILDVAKLQEGRMSFQFVDADVSSEIKTIVDSFTRPASDKGLTLHYEMVPLPLISVDLDRFRQVLVNFIGNAIKYTPAGEVRISTSVADDAYVHIRISDTGMGISADDQKKLFQKFFRVKSDETAKIIGTGLGLWITHEMVKNMAGTIAVESIRGKGTDFIVSFPIKNNKKPTA